MIDLFCWVVVILAILLVTPNLLWQNANGWPQVTLSRAIAAGESGSPQPRWRFLPYQLVLISPTLVPAWVIGLGQLLGSTPTRRITVITALGLSLIINATLMIPVLPVQVMTRSPIADVNYDGGETAGWPEFVGPVAGVVNNLPADERDCVVLLTGNHGEVGAIDHFGWTWTTTSRADRCGCAAGSEHPGHDCGH